MFTKQQLGTIAYPFQLISLWPAWERGHDLHVAVKGVRGNRTHLDLQQTIGVNYMN